MNTITELKRNIEAYSTILREMESRNVKYESKQMSPNSIQCDIPEGQGLKLREDLAALLWFENGIDFIPYVMNEQRPLCKPVSWMEDNDEWVTTMKCILSGREYYFKSSFTLHMFDGSWLWVTFKQGRLIMMSLL